MEEEILVQGKGKAKAKETSPPPPAKKRKREPPPTTKEAATSKVAADPFPETRTRSATPEPLVAVILTEPS